jgi:putative transcriptional regulator
MRSPRSLNALLALLLLFAACSSADEAVPPKALLITARADLPDPNFRNSVVLVSNNLGEGPLGVILNRPTSIAVSRIFPDIEGLAALPDKLFFGGPVNVGGVSFLFGAAKRPDKAIAVLDGLYFSTDEKLLRELLGRKEPMRSLRIFVGYSGWAPGQLENEIARGDWTPENATAEAVFRRRAEHPWPDRKGPDTELRG